MDEKTLSEYLGVTEEVDVDNEGVNEQEPAAPAAGDGANDPEVADPEDSNEQDENESDQEQEGSTDDAAEDGTGGADDNGDAKDATDDKPSDRRDNAKQAAKRRERERQEAIAAAVKQAVEAERAKHRAEMEEFFSKAGLQDTAKGTPIRNMDEFRTWRESFDNARRKQIAEKSGLSDEEFAELIAESPEVRAAKQATEEAAKVKAAALVDAEIAKISEIDPSVHTVDDLLNHPTYDKVYELVGRGYSISDAYKLENFERLSAAAAERAKQAARNAARSTEHLTRTQARGTALSTVPESILTAYRQIMPGLSDEEYLKHYNAYLKTTTKGS